MPESIEEQARGFVRFNEQPVPPYYDHHVFDDIRMWAWLFRQGGEALAAYEMLDPTERRRAVKAALRLQVALHPEATDLVLSKQYPFPSSQGEVWQGEFVRLRTDSFGQRNTFSADLILRLYPRMQVTKDRTGAYLLQVV